MTDFTNSIGHIKCDYLELLKQTTDTPSKFDYCVKDFGDKIEMAYEYGKETIIIPKSEYVPERYPEFHLGDKVERIDGTRKGVIYKVYWVWHYSDNPDNPDYFAYFIDYGDRKSTRRTKAEEIRKIDE